MSNLKLRMSQGGERAFSAVEALVSVAVLALVVLFAVTLFQNSNKMSRSSMIQGNSQQSARVAVDIITRDMRSLGYGIDMGQGQQGLVYAGAWDVIFNANIAPAPDNPLAPVQPAAMDVNLAPAAVPAGGPLYAPPASYATGAETVRYSLDSNDDGAIDATDQGDDPEEASPNPYDFVLRKEVYGVRADGTNGGAGEPVAIVRGPVADQSGTLPRPLFSYWIDDDDDRATPEILHGDADANGRLSQAEIAALTPVPAAQLALVTRAVITVSAEDGESQGRGDYRTRELVSSVSFRNLIRRSAVVTGIVFQDQDADGVLDPGDAGIPNVTVRLSSGPSTQTGPNGQYVFDVDAGVFTVTELDPPGYVSTTSNTVAVTANTGSTNTVHFGDRPGSGVGQISGTVYFDQNQNQSKDGGETGIADVVVTLHTGQADTTNGSGNYSFQVPVGTYTVVETDSTGWSSTTSNVVEVILSIDGQQEVVDFGDVPGGLQGTIRAIVYLDTNADGVHDPTEVGIADVPITVVGVDSTLTDGSGVSSSAVPAGLHSVRERDLAGYSSSTPNLITNVLVLPDSTVTVEFGDIYNSNVNFTIVAVGTTNRALSIASTDLVEDDKGDSDIILGTQSAVGANNLHVWHNQRRNSGTAITALFNATPSFSRAAGAAIPSMMLQDIDGDVAFDLLTGLDTGTAANLKQWVTITSGGGAGTFPNSPNYTHQTAAGTSVVSIAQSSWPGWSDRVLFVGTRSGAGTGRLEVWVDSSRGNLSHAMSSDLTSDSLGPLGEVTCLAGGDFNNDGYPDIAVGQDRGSYQGKVSIFTGDPSLDLHWNEFTVLNTEGAVLGLCAVDMEEDASNDVDLIVGTSKLAGAGVIELWLNENGVFGDPDSSSGRVRSDWVNSTGEVLSLRTARLDPDVFPDLIAGVRTSPYAGALRVYRTFGFLPSSGQSWSYPGSGEVVTMVVDDYNIDGRKDVAVGTRTAATTGQLVIYFGQ